MTPQWPEHFSPEIVSPVSAAYISTYTFALEAWRRGLKVTFLEAGLRHFVIADEHGRSVRFHRASPEMNTAEAITLTDHKYHTVSLLQKAGVPTPESVHIWTAETEVEQLQARAETIGYPVVLKRLDGLMGQGVYTDISGPEELAKRYRALKDEMGLSEVMLEPHVSGDDYRVFVIDGEVVASCRRIPANVVGDGIRTVDELIRQKNRDRRKNPFLAKGLIHRDAEVEDYVSSYGMTFDSVPEEGQTIRLRGAANGSAGGDLEDETPTLSQKAQQAAIDAVAAVPGLFAAGVDVLFDAETGRAVIIELNAIPAIGTNMYPTSGTGQDIPKAMIDRCFPDSHRTGDERDKNLHFPMQRIRDVLRSGVAESVTVGALPAHRYPVRRRIRFASERLVSRREIVSLQRIAQRLALAGTLKRLDDGTLELIAGGTAREMSRFVTRLSKLLGAEPSVEEDWSGPLSFGFTVV